MLAVVIAEGVAILLLGLLVAGLLRSHAEILRALHDLGAGVDPEDASGPSRGSRQTSHRVSARTTGSAAYDVAGVDPHGDAVAVAIAGADHDTLLAFLSTGCDSCRPFWTALQGDLGLPGVRVLVVVADEESESELARLAGPAVEVVASTAAWEVYEVPGAPHFVYVDGPSARVVGEGTGPDWTAVRGLLTQANADRAVHQQAHGTANQHAVPIEWRDNPTRIDAELAAAGIGPGHPSLTGPPDDDNAG
jgi:hypothetical protein